MGQLWDKSGMPDLAGPLRPPISRSASCCEHATRHLAVDWLHRTAIATVEKLPILAWRTEAAHAPRANMVHG